MSSTKKSKKSSKRKSKKSLPTWEVTMRLRGRSSQKLARMSDAIMGAIGAPTSERDMGFKQTSSGSMVATDRCLFWPVHSKAEADSIAAKLKAFKADFGVKSMDVRVDPIHRD